MPVTEADRHRLHESLKSSLGPVDADTFMNLMPPADWRDVAATKDDIAALKDDIAALRGDLLRTFGTWLFASQAGVIAAVALIVGFLR